MSELHVPTEWVTFKCGMTPCTVMIRMQVGNKGVLPKICKWCEQGVSYWQRAQLKKENAA